jgi:hypothetical protein
MEFVLIREIDGYYIVVDHYHMVARISRIDDYRTTVQVKIIGYTCPRISLPSQVLTPRSYKRVKQDLTGLPNKKNTGNRR